MKLLSNESGMSMLEVVIAGGMMAAMSMGALKMMSSQQKSSKKFALVDDSRSVLGRMKSLLSNKIACKNTLTGQSVNGTIPGIKSASNTTIYSKNKEYGRLKITNIEVKNSSIPLVGTSVTGEGNVNIIVSFDKIGPKSFPIFATATEGKITGCYVDTERFLDSSCELIGGSVKNNKCVINQITYSKDSTIACNADNEGAQRWNSDLKVTQTCNGVSWFNYRINWNGLPQKAVHNPWAYFWNLDKAQHKDTMSECSGSHPIAVGWGVQEGTGDTLNDNLKAVCGYLTTNSVNNTVPAVTFDSNSRRRVNGYAHGTNQTWTIQCAADEVVTGVGLYEGTGDYEWDELRLYCNKPIFKAGEERLSFASLQSCSWHWYYFVNAKGDSAVYTCPQNTNLMGIGVREVSGDFVRDEIAALCCRSSAWSN